MMRGEMTFDEAKEVRAAARRHKKMGGQNIILGGKPGQQRVRHERAPFYQTDQKSNLDLWINGKILDPALWDIRRNNDALELVVLAEIDPIISIQLCQRDGGYDAWI